MALDALSGAKYNDSAISTQKPVVEMNKIDRGAQKLNVTENPSVNESVKVDKELDAEQKERQASKKRIKDAISNANSKMKNTRCEFSYHEKTNRVSIKILDKDTNEVIREIPPEETLEMVEKMWELAGMLVDEKR